MIAALFWPRRKTPTGKPERPAGAPSRPAAVGADSAIADPPADAPPGLSPGRAAGERAILNTAYRSGGEIVGRLASLLLFAYAGRQLGQHGLGAFVFAIAFTGLVM